MRCSISCGRQSRPCRTRSRNPTRSAPRSRTWWLRCCVWLKGQRSTRWLATVACNLGADLDQPLAQAGQRPRLRRERSPDEALNQTPLAPHRLSLSGSRCGRWWQFRYVARRYPPIVNENLTAAFIRSGEERAATEVARQFPRAAVFSPRDESNCPAITGAETSIRCGRDSPLEGDGFELPVPQQIRSDIETVNQHRTGTPLSAGYHLDSKSRSRWTGGSRSAPIGTPPKRWLLVSNQCGSSNRERGPGSVLIYNWVNSMSSSGIPARNAIALPSPVQVWAAVQEKQTRP